MSAGQVEFEGWLVPLLRPSTALQRCSSICPFLQARLSCRQAADAAPSLPPRSPVGALRKQRGPAPQDVREQQQLEAGLTGDVLAAVSRAEFAERDASNLSRQLYAVAKQFSQHRYLAALDCEELRQQAAQAAAREQVARARADRACRELAVLKRRLRKLRDECVRELDNSSEAAAAAGKAAPRPCTPRLLVRVVVRRAAVKRPVAQRKKVRIVVRCALGCAW